MDGVGTYFFIPEGEAVALFIRDRRIEAARNLRVLFYEESRPPILSRRRRDHPLASGHKKLLFST